MKLVNLLNRETATDLKYEIISARSDMLIDPVTLRIEIPVQARVTAACAWQLKES